MDFISTKDNPLNKVVALELNEENNQLVDVIKVKSCRKFDFKLKLWIIFQEKVLKGLDIQS